ncbi:MAG TPA: PhzF family phenazine biosynthesis protein [Vicinamibacteria bacterium]|nr:PhzF family phenazine biosynthesis protein [Vicinamibacteria bacterium]
MLLISSTALFGQDRTYRYLHLDVFTDRVLTGNQLAVFLAPQGLSDDEMMLIAREMNFSESTFVFPAEAAGTDFRVRIFTPSRELDFAGHPTIGTAFALARAGKIAPGRKRVVFGEGIGPVPVDLEWERSELRFAWMYQLEPTFGKTIEDVATVAGALGVEASDIQTSGLPVQEVSCGATFLFVPMATRAALDRASLDRAAMGGFLERLQMQRRGVFLFSKEPGGDDATVYSRMLSFRGIEDPATGSASGPLGAYLVHHGAVPKEKAREILSRQGVKMGRPSRVYISIGLEGDAIKEVRVGGASAFVGEGTIELGSR